MPIKGDLSSVQLADVFQMLAMSQREGTLVVKDSKTERRIYFSPQGVTLLTSGERRAGKLGEVLLKEGKVTREQLDECLAEQRSSGGKLGEMLILKGLVTQKDIDAVVRQQIEEQIYDLFLWRDASFEFLEGPADDNRDTIVRSATTLTFDVNGLLLEALRRVDEWDIINQHISTLDAVFAFTDEKYRPQSDGSSVSGREWRLYPLINGEHSLKEIAHATGLSSFDVCRLVKEFAKDGRVAALTPDELVKRAQALEAAGKEQEALHLYKNAFAMRGDVANVALLKQCAGLAEKNALPADALDFYRRAAHAANDAGDAEALAGCLAHVCSLDPVNADSALARFDVLLALQKTEEAKKAGEVAASVALDQNRAADARAVLTKIIAMDPHHVGARVLLCRALKAMQADRELREELRMLTKSLTAGQPGDDAILAQLRQIEPDFFREEYLPPVVQERRQKEKRSRTALAVGVVAISVVLALGIFLLTRGFGPHTDGDGGGGTGGGGKKTAGKADIDSLCIGFDEAIKKVDLERAAKLLEEMDKRANAVDDRDAFVTIKFKRSTLQLETEALGLAAQAKAKVNAKDYAGAAALIRKLKSEYQTTETAPRALVTLHVDSVPDGARVFVGDDDSGKTTPSEIELDTIVPKLVLKAEGFEDETVRLTPDLVFEGMLTTVLSVRTMVWRQPVGIPLQGGLQLYGRTLIAATEDKIRGFDIESKGLSAGRGWPKEIGKPIKGGPLVVGSSVFAVTQGGELFGFSLADLEKQAKLAWAPKALDGTPVGEPSKDPLGRILVTLEKKIVAVDPATGEIAWTMDLDARRAPAAPAGTGRDIVVITTRDEAYAFTWSKAPVWGPVPLHGPAAPGVPPVVTEFAVIVCASDGTVHLLSPKDGRPIRALSIGPTNAAPVVDGATAYVTSVDKNIYSFDLAGGGAPITGKADGPVSGSATVRDGIVFIGSEDKCLHALDGKTLKPLWKMKTPKVVKLSPCVGETLAIVAAEDQLFAVKWK